MSPIVFTVPGKPIATNAAYRMAIIKGHASMHMTPDGKAWKAAIACAAAAPGRRLYGPVRVDLDIFFDSERPDIDGPVKLAQDALQGARLGKARDAPLLGGCIANDRQVRELFVRRFVDRAHPRIEVRVQALEREP